jgi:hypothetical protein
MGASLITYNSSLFISALSLLSFLAFASGTLGNLPLFINIIIGS